MAIERTLSSLVSITIVTTNDRRHIKRVKLLRFPSGRAGCVCGLSYAKKGERFRRCNEIGRRYGREGILPSLARGALRVWVTGGGYLGHHAEGWIGTPSGCAALCYWFYRLWREPRQLWRRYTTDLREFDWIAACTRRDLQSRTNHPKGERQNSNDGKRRH